jgi:hypothetical protein
MSSGGKPMSDSTNSDNIGVKLLAIGKPVAQ